MMTKKPKRKRQRKNNTPLYIAVGIGGLLLFSSSESQEFLQGGGMAGSGQVSGIEDGGASETQESGEGIITSETYEDDDDLSNIEILRDAGAEDRIRQTSGSSGTQTIVSEEDEDVVDELAREGVDIDGQVTVTDSSGSADRVLDFEERQSRSAEGGYSRVGGGVGFEDVENVGDEDSSEEEETPALDTVREGMFNLRGGL